MYSRASYLGIQRKLDEAKVKKIAEYVKNRDSAFPTSILLVSMVQYTFELQFCNLTFLFFHKMVIV